MPDAPFHLRVLAPVGVDTHQSMAPTAHGASLEDRLGRTVRYLRLSLTTACAMRCIYCRPATHGNGHGSEQMTPCEIESLVRHLVQRRHVRKVRLTGGEPTSRPDLVEIISRIAAIEGVENLAMTTNGLTLARMAESYFRAGLRRINVSLDSLDPDRFARLTGFPVAGGLSRVLEGIDAARGAGLTPIKINTVVVRHENESDLPALVDYAADRGLEIRFIELMPMGPLATQWMDRYVPESQMRRLLDPVVQSWAPIAHGSESARCFTCRLHDGRIARVGLVTSMSCLFCATCDRVRIAADGGFYPCLMDRPTGNLMRALRPRFDAELLDHLLFAGLSSKKREHPLVGTAVMTEIGG